MAKSKSVMRVLAFFPFLFVLLCFCACEESKVINEDVQCTFFNTSFGASKDELVKNFNDVGFILDDEISTDEQLHFDRLEGNGKYGFAGIEWEMLRVFLRNNQFESILFYKSLDGKDEAIKEYKRVVKKISKQYIMMQEKPDDPNIIQISRGTSFPGREVRVYCDRRESIDGDTLFYVQLEYDDYNIRRDDVSNGDTIN